MGNAHSAEEPRRPSQKLSKPKTGNHTTAGLLSPGFSNTARRLSNAQLPNPPAPSSTAASTPTTSSAGESSGGLDRRLNSITSLHSAPGAQRESKRRSLFRSRSTRGGADPASPTHSGGTGSWRVDRMSRASSMTYESAMAYYGPTDLECPLPKSESRISWNYNPTSYEAKRLLNLAEEPGLEQAAAMSENKMTVVTETTWKSSNPTNPPSAPITRANSDVSLYMPVRRRSMIQKPGVATRSTPAQDIPPVPQLSFRHSHPPTPSLSRQQSIESYRNGIMSMPPRIDDMDSLQRAVTPCEDEYLSIGAFKLGSLRITNGSPSPATPDTDRTRASKGHAISREGYFSGAYASEAGFTANAAAQGSSPSPMILPEISQSPLSSPQSQPASPALRTTSKATALEDLLFDDEGQPEYSSVEVLDVRLDPNAKPSHAEVERDIGVGVTRTDSGFVSTASPASEVSHKPLAKADSGYSSNVSLRSFHGKARLPEDQFIATPREKQTPGREPSPPPVPPKDTSRHFWTPQGRRGNVASKDVSMRSLAENRIGTTGATRQALNSIVTLPSGGRGPASPVRELRSPGSVRASESDHSSSALSPGGGSQKPSRLQRFLSGARRPVPPTIHATHAVDQNAIPPVPRDIERKLQQHSVGRFPSAAKKLALKSRSSMDTLKTIFSVGSFEASHEAAYPTQNARTVPESENKDGLWRQTLSSVPASISNADAHVIPQKSVSRKPALVRQGLTTGSGGNDIHGVASPVDTTAPNRSPAPSARTMSLTFLAERGMKPRHRASDLELAHAATGLPSPALPSPVAKAMSVESNNKTSQTVDTRRRPQSLRVPRPLSTASLSRRTSRESLHNLASKTSMDSMRSYSSQPGIGNSPAHSRSGSGITMDPRRLQSFRQSHSPQSSPHKSPASATNPGSRRNSIASAHSEGGGGWQRHPSHQQPLRHRASYDGYSYQYQHQQQRGHAPSMSNGYTAPLKPLPYDPHSSGQLDAAATWSRSQADAAAGQWYQTGLPHVPRVAHHRNRSMGNRNSHGQNVPYRVLHSYNSPAYRHAPIWG